MILKYNIVTKVLSAPRKCSTSELWGVKVEFDGLWGLAHQELFFYTKVKAERVKVGYKFLG